MKTITPELAAELEKANREWNCVTDPEHWIEYGIFTVDQFYDFLDEECERNIRRSGR